MDHEEKLDQHFRLARLGTLSGVLAAICVVVLGVMSIHGGQWGSLVVLAIFTLCILASIGFFEKANRIIREIGIDLDNRMYEAVMKLEKKMRETSEDRNPS